MHILAKAVICTLSACVPALAQEAQGRNPLLDNLADDLATQIQKAEVTGNKIVQLVPFSLTDELQKRLAQRATGFLILDSSVVLQLIEEDRIEPRDLQNMQAALWLGGRFATPLVVYGETKEVDDSVEVVLSLVNTHGDVKATALKALNYPVELRPAEIKISTRLKKTPELLKAIADFESRSIPKRRPEANPDEQGVYQAGKGEVSVPECQYCPNPPFSDEAVTARAQATVVLAVVVGGDGTIVNVEPVRGAPFGFTRQAMRIVRTWKLLPAMNAGTPVKVRMLVEVVFRQH